MRKKKFAEKLANFFRRRNQREKLRDKKVQRNEISKGISRRSLLLLFFHSRTRVSRLSEKLHVAYSIKP